MPWEESESVSSYYRSFYRLSKIHHPDANPNDPSASQTFSLLSESYTILSDPPRRAAYDRDVLRLHHTSSHAATAARGSYYSPAGGRPASGLSRRRTTFRGPPPSFYRSGGWGDQSEKRRKAHEDSTGTGASSGTKSGDHHTHHAGERANPWSAHHHHHHHQHTGGMGPGGDPFGHHDEVPHFDKRATEKTQRREDQRRWERRRAFGDDDIEFEPQMSLGAHFMVIIGILATSFIVPVMYLRMVRTNRKKREDGL
jgi:curved DNA-binding protein CbpA